MQVAQMTVSDISNSPGVYGQFYVSHSDSTCAPNFKQEPIIHPSIPNVREPRVKLMICYDIENETTPSNTGFQTI